MVMDSALCHLACRVHKMCAVRAVEKLRLCRWLQVCHAIMIMCMDSQLHCAPVSVDAQMSGDGKTKHYCCCAGNNSAQLACSNPQCRVVLVYPRGASQVQCSLCGTVNNSMGVRTSLSTLLVLRFEVTGPVIVGSLVYSSAFRSFEVAQADLSNRYPCLHMHCPRACQASLVNGAKDSQHSCTHL